MIAFWILAPIMVIAALGILFVRKAVHAALLLAVVMISLAVLYAVLDAPFLFAVQIIVYTGAILMLFLFVLMLVGVDASDSVVETIRGQRVLAVLVGLLLGLVLVLGRRPDVARHGRRPDRGQRRRQHPGARRHPVLPLRLRLRDHQRAADHRGASARWCSRTASGSRPSRPRPSLAAQRIRDYADTGRTSARCRRPGVFARHNAVDTPALLPDGTAAESSISRVLAARGTVRSAPALAEDIEEVQRSSSTSGHRATRPGPTAPATAPRRTGA